MFNKKDESIQSYHDFWDWFRKNEKAFFKVVKEKGDIEKEFFNKISPKLNELREGFYLLTGMYDAHTVELVITADGIVKNFVFVEELVSAAPMINGWKFTALKPALDITAVSISMEDYDFNQDNIHFYANDHPESPDEIDITVVHDSLNEDNQSIVTNGTYLFLDNMLGEQDFASLIDTIHIVGRADVSKELVPIGKLKDFLIWRQKEFVEKYEGVWHSTENGNYTALEARLNNGDPVIAIIDSDLLAWDSKASHPWIMTVEINYDGTSSNGLPDKETYQLLDNIEEDILSELKDKEGYLNIGRQTAGNVREIYFACKDFRKPSKVLAAIQQQYADTNEINYTIYKDKYWQSFDHFINH